MRRPSGARIRCAINIGVAAVAPPFAGFIGDLIGIPATVMIVSALTLATIPFAFLLKDPAPGRPAYLNQAGGVERELQVGDPAGFRARYWTYFRPDLFLKS